MKLLARIGAPFAWKVVRQHDGCAYFEKFNHGSAQLPLVMIRATSLLVALLVPINADARLGIPDALGVLRAAMIPFELPEPFFLVPRDLPLPPRRGGYAARRDASRSLRRAQSRGDAPQGEACVLELGREPINLPGGRVVRVPYAR